MSESCHEAVSCTLEEAVGRVESCPGVTCPFWDPRSATCIFHGVEPELLSSPELSGHLLSLRRSLESYRAATERSRLSRLLNDEEAAEIGEEKS